MTALLLPWSTSIMDGMFEFYDEGKDSFFTKSWMRLFEDATKVNRYGIGAAPVPGAIGPAPAVALNCDRSCSFGQTSQ